MNSMYDSMYQALKESLAQVDGLTAVQWYNNQYEGIIRTAPVVYVEFSPLEIEPVTRMSGQTDIGIRLHVVTEVPADLDGYIPDESVAEHHALATDVLEAAAGCCLPFDDSATHPLELTGWTPLYTYNGLLATVIDLKTIG